MTSPYGTGVTGTYPISGNSNIDPLIWLGYKWGASGPGTSAAVTYSFPTISSTWSTDYAIYLNNEPFNNFQPFTAAQQTAAKQALALWSEVANITFQQVAETSSNVGDIRFGNSGAVTNSPAAAWAYTPYDDNTAFEYPESGDVWFDKAFSYNLQLLPGQFGFATMIHEIGHAIGLDHPFDDGYGEPVLPANLDTDQYTVMSYTYEPSTMAYASTPQLLDILAIQHIYGANMTTRTGNDTYKFSATTEVNKTIWDAGGIDTLDFSNQTRFVDGSLQEGQFLRFGGSFAYNTRSILGIAYNVTIENVIIGNSGSQILGNDAANRMIGGNGADTFDGHGGDDHLEGRGGNDSLHDNYGNNWLDGGAGIDSLWSEDGNDTLLGGSGNDSIYAGKGDDLVDGGLGSDWLQGAGGNDTYILDSVGDQIAGEQYNWADTDDVARSSVTVNLMTLGEGAIEHAFLTGTTAINATGNDGNNGLTGNDGANVLDGKGGADTMTGGKGNDTYWVDELGDQVNETTGGALGGIDLVKSSVTFSLGANVENLTLTGSGNTDGVGNSLNNIIIGNNGANRLDGGVGNDTMTGGKGNDIYVVGAIGDIANETVLNSAGGGVDTVESSITYSLATRTNIENLTLTGTGKINGTGNALANIITGNSNDNILDGGLGADMLKGGAGNDTYIFNSSGDTANEGANTDSNDSVKSSALIAAAFAGVENYTYSGTGAWNFTGNTLNNKISGGSGNDTLNGADGNDTLLGNGGNDTLFGGIGDDLLDGGVGNDKMKGGAGNDTYVMNALTDSIDEEANADTEDLVKSSVTVSLLSAGLLAIENVILTGTTAINATGNNADNELTGNASANKLDGGVGADILTGGNGADIYVVDNVGDQVIETTGGAAGGIDLVQSKIDFSLASLVNVEKLTLIGSADIDATGNALANTLIGNDGANKLDGGLGNDTMTGGKGDDTYVVNSLTDVVNETVLNSAGGGVDTVVSSVTFTLATRTNIENLTLSGGGNINGTGNALNNEMTGNTGPNKLDGGAGNDILDGGSGNDTLIGGLGNDFLHGGAGIDNLNGGAGIDTFDYDALSDGGDIIGGFTKGAGGDVLDLAGLWDDINYAGSDPFLDAILSFGTVGANTIVNIDADGVGGNAATILATLLNVTLSQTDTTNYVV